MASPGDPVHVFIVEDNDPDVFLVEEALRAQGIAARIERCQDGEEAIRALPQMGQAPLPDIIIIDLNLPKVTGFEILKRVRSLKELDQVPVLILTSSLSRNDQALSLQLGADSFIAKPPTLPDFLSSVGSGIRALLERDRGEPRARLHPSRGERRRPHIRLRVYRRLGRSRAV